MCTGQNWIISSCTEYTMIEKIGVANPVSISELTKTAEENDLKLNPRQTLAQALVQNQFLRRSFRMRPQTGTRWKELSGMVNDVQKHT